MYLLPRQFAQLTGTLFILALTAGLPASAQTASTAPQPIDRIVAVVNRGIITQSQLNEKTAEIAQQLQSAGQTLPSHAVLQKQVLNRMILEKLQLEVAKQNGISVDPETLNSTLNTIAANNNMSLADLHKRVVSSGQAWTAFIQRISDRLVIQKLEQREVNDRVHISHQEVRDFLAQHAGQLDPGIEYHLAQILVPIPDAANPKQVEAALNKAETLRKQAGSGTAFSKLAIANSAGQNALKGGDMGWMSTNQMPTYFVRTVNILKTGEVSQPIRSPSGYHLVKLLGLRGGKQMKVTQYNVRQILITPTANLDNAQARAKIGRLRTQLLHGASFAKLAEANSMDPGSAADGGNLGWLNPAQLVPQFSKVMITLPVGKLSQPFHSPFGWHLIEVLGKRSLNNTEQMLRTQAQNILYQRKRTETLTLWLRKLRDKAYVDIRLNRPTQPAS